MDLYSIPERVPAASVLMSSSAPRTFSMATPNTLYSKAGSVEVVKKDIAQLTSHPEESPPHNDTQKLHILCFLSNLCEFLCFM